MENRWEDGKIRGKGTNEMLLGLWQMSHVADNLGSSIVSGYRKYLGGVVPSCVSICIQ